MPATLCVWPTPCVTPAPPAVWRIWPAASRVKCTRRRRVQWRAALHPRDRDVANWERRTAMKRELTRQVDADGVLRFALELGEEYANKFVCLTVASIEPPPDISPPNKEEGEKLNDDLGGKW